MIVLIPVKHVKKITLFLVKAKVMKYYILGANMAYLLGNPQLTTVWETLI